MSLLIEAPKIDCLGSNFSSVNYQLCLSLTKLILRSIKMGIIELLEGLNGSTYEKHLEWCLAHKKTIMTSIPVSLPR